MCPYQIFKERGVPKVLISCFEIKVSKSDFKSTNGHNFVGNLNYYVMPNELASKVASLVPAGVGIIAFIDTPKMRGLRRKRDARFREMTDTEQMWMILSVCARERAARLQKVSEGR